MSQARTMLRPLLIALFLLMGLAGNATASEAHLPFQQEPAPAAPTAGDATVTPDQWSRILDEGVIVFSTAADYPPFEFYNSKFELDGFDIALAKALGEQLGLEVRFRDYAFDGLLDAVQLGDVDAAIAAISVTPDRQQLVDFSNLYYIGQSVAMASDTFTATLRAATDFTGLTVGVQRGSTFQAWAQENLVDAGVIGQENLIAYPTISAAIVDVRSDELDVVLLGQLTADQALKNADDLILVGEKFYQQQYAIAAPRGSTLVAQLNTALVAVQSDGTFAELVTLYLRDEPEEVTPDEDTANVENPVVTDPVTPATPEPCIEGMTFVGDLNLDDQNMTAPPIMAPGQDFTKGWRVRNSGTCPWEADFAIVYVNGNRVEAAMNGQPTPIGRTVAPGEMIDLYVTLRAPQVYGTFQGFWQMRNSTQQYFGEAVWVGIQIPDPNPPPPPPPPSHPDPNLRADTDWITQGQCTAIRWDVEGVMAVFFIENGSEQGVGGHDARTVCPPQTTSYMLRVLYNDQPTSDYSITVNVNPNSEYTLNFWADSYAIDSGQCTALRWDVRNVQAVYLNGEGVPGVSARDVCPGQTTTYTLVVTKMDGGQDSRQVTVEVRNAPPPVVEWPEIERFSVSANEIARGQCVTFEWRTDNVNGVNLTRGGTPLLVGAGSNGSAQDCPENVGLQEYRLDAYSTLGQVSQTVMVNVVGPQPR